MLPIGPLMIEHRLIERMFKAVARGLHDAERVGKVDPLFIDTAVDFIRNYADRCHHGKEEGILFRELNKKPVSDEHRRIMDELVDEHRWGRDMTGRLAEANEKYGKGEDAALPVIFQSLRSLVEFYPRHIEKEDKRFFMPIMKYFDAKEKDRMLGEGYAFDQALFHRKYEEVVQLTEGRAG